MRENKVGFKKREQDWINAADSNSEQPEQMTTVTIRVPYSLKSEIKEFLSTHGRHGESMTSIFIDGARKFMGERVE